jgi:3-phenylpropionate/trans-cinnamate dioxygenase ferredoxin reductase subunit
MASQFQYVIVGGGTAAAHAVEGIRGHDSKGSIILFSNESHLPYDRPPLSKGLWLGKTTIEELPVHDRKFYASHGAELRLKTEIVDLRPSERTVRDNTGNTYHYEKLLIATGGNPRVLSFGHEIIRYYRTLDDFLALMDAAGDRESFLLIGGGFIGAELAAALAIRGKHVVMVFPDKLLLQRILPADLAHSVTEYYRSKGVFIEAEDSATAVSAEGGSAIVTLRSGKRFAADVVVGAIGLDINTRLAGVGGLEVGNGIVVNEFLQTSDPSIYAAGDVAFFPSTALEKRVRIEHWDNARAQGVLAGENMAGATKRFDYLPYFYSDLFDLGFEAVGDLDSRLNTFAEWREPFREGVVHYFDQGRVRGVLLWNVWEKVDAARALINEKNVYSNLQSVRGKLLGSR